MEVNNSSSTAKLSCFGLMMTSATDNGRSIGSWQCADQDKMGIGADLDYFFVHVALNYGV